MSRLRDRSGSPIVDVSLSDHESEDSYIIVSPSHSHSHSRSSSHEWDDIQDEFKHEQQHEHHLQEQEQHEEHQTTQHDEETSRPSQNITPIDVIAPLDHTIDIQDSDSDGDEHDESQPIMTESTYDISICRFHNDEEEQEEPTRNLSLSQSFVADTTIPTPSPCVDLVSSLHVCDDTEPELELVVETQKHVQEPAHVDDAPDYPLASASTILCDSLSWEHQQAQTPYVDLYSPTPSYSLLYDDPPLPDVYVDEYGYSHFQRHPAFCIGEQECWEAKHIHDEQFNYDPSSGTWRRGMDDDMDANDDDLSYLDPEDISVASQCHMHKKDPMKYGRTRGIRSSRVIHQHVKQQQWSPSLAPITRPSPPSPPSPQCSAYTSLRRRGRRSISPDLIEPQVTQPTRHPGSHKRRGPNFYERIRGRAQHSSTVAARHQADQHVTDLAIRYLKRTTTPPLMDDVHVVHGSNCSIDNCAHCRHVARLQKDRKHTKGRHMERDMGNKLEAVNDAWE